MLADAACPALTSTTQPLMTPAVSMMSFWFCYHQMPLCDVILMLSLSLLSICWHFGAVIIKSLPLCDDMLMLLSHYHWSLSKVILMLSSSSHCHCALWFKFGAVKSLLSFGLIVKIMSSIHWVIANCNSCHIRSSWSNIVQNILMLLPRFLWQPYSKFIQKGLRNEDVKSFSKIFSWRLTDLPAVNSAKKTLMQ